MVEVLREDTAADAENPNSTSTSATPDALPGHRDRHAVVREDLADPSTRSSTQSLPLPLWQASGGTRPSGELQM